MVEDAVVMGGTTIRSGAVVRHCIIAENVLIESDAIVGAMPDENSNGVATIASGVCIGKKAKIGPDAMARTNVKDGEEEW